MRPRPLVDGTGGGPAAPHPADKCRKGWFWEITVGVGTAWSLGPQLCPYCRPQSGDWGGGPAWCPHLPAGPPSSHLSGPVSASGLALHPIFPLQGIQLA